MKPTQVELIAVLDYSPDTGILINRYLDHIYTGQFVSFRGIRYPIANIIWCIHYGTWPREGYLIDHEDCNRWNWRIENLREATHRQNSYNVVKKGSSSFPKGVYDCGRLSKPYQAQIRIEGKKVNLGRFTTVEEAKQAYDEAALKHHGEFACLK